MIEIKRIQQQPDLAQAIYAVMIAVYPVSPWTLEQIQADLSQDQTWYALAYDGGRSDWLSSCAGESFWGRSPAIAVKQTYQGQGIASALFAQLPTDKEIFLEVQKVKSPSTSILQERKMAVIAERKAYYHDPVEDAIIMKREIDEG